MNTDNETLSELADREMLEFEQHNVRLTAMFYLLTGTQPDELYICCATSDEYVMVMDYDVVLSLFRRGNNKPIYSNF